MITVYGYDRVLIAGDSIAGLPYWGPVAMDMVDARMAPIPLTGLRYNGIVSGQPAIVHGTMAVNAVASTQPTITRVVDSVGGSGVGDLAANFATRISGHSPDVIWISCGVNDVPADDVPTFTSNVDSLFSQIRAWSATVPVLWCSILTRDGELWTTSGGIPVWNNGPSDAVCDSLNSVIASACAANDATYVDVRGPALAYEVANNPIPLDHGLLVDFGLIHPTAAGSQFIANNVMANVTVVNTPRS